MFGRKWVDGWITMDEQRHEVWFRGQTNKLSVEDICRGTE